MSVRKKIIQIRYVLRHTPLSDLLIDDLTDLLEELRDCYGERKNEFTKNDIKFLQEIGELVEILMELAPLINKLAILKQQKEIVSSLIGVSEKLIEFDGEGEAFAVVRSQAENIMQEATALRSSINSN